MSNRHRDRGKLAPFVALFRHTIKSAAWKAASVGARATFFELKASYHTKAQNAVFLSSRDGAESLNVSKDTICKWLRELEHYGFIVKVRGHHLGVDGEGKAALYRLTDCPYAGKPATYDFQNWSSELFEPETAKRTMTEADKKRLTESRRKQKPVLTVRTPRPNGKDIRAEGEMVKSRCGAVAVGCTYLLPPLSIGGALVVQPWLRFHIPLIEPDKQISRIRLSDKTSRFAFACNAICSF